ncbi:hypothetical protein M9H77_05105 [Catharanthus roseus]|uniref:Uncharacterized protein n=1 Tax=Catharanthus roseus TaxID=4058 RepID=A0ACC0CGA7_CATRO|nr:hypothetical protein M9H77_05105 [Catharanthus roseus]
MVALNLQNPQMNNAAVPGISSRSRLIAFTTPHNYAGRLSQVIKLHGWSPLSCPSIIVEITPQTISSIQNYLLTPNSHPGKSFLEDFSALAFTSRTGITAFSEALTPIEKPPLDPKGENPFTISALGKDSELLDESFLVKICENPSRIKVLIPQIATPKGLVDSLGLGQGRKVLCPVPLVLGLEEPPVVPDFLNDLAKKGWIPVRVNAYKTRWAGPKCAEVVKNRGNLDAIVFTSTGEVEGFLKSLKELGLNWEMMRKRFPRMVVAAHGPVTACGAEKLGVEIDVVSSKFDSFDGVIDALDYRWNKSLD